MKINEGGPIMKPMRWNNSRNLFSAQNEVGRMFDSFFSPELFGEMTFKSSGWLPGMDVAEDNDKFTVSVELPGLSKEDVNINAIEPVGNYAVRLVFDDNHDSGLYSWEHLYNLGKNQDQKWKEYLERLEAAGHKRKTH